MVNRKDGCADGSVIFLMSYAAALWLSSSADEAAAYSGLLYLLYIASVWIHASRGLAPATAVLGRVAGVDANTTEGKSHIR